MCLRLFVRGFLIVVVVGVSVLFLVGLQGGTVSREGTPPLFYDRGRGREAERQREGKSGDTTSQVIQPPNVEKCE